MNIPDAITHPVERLDSLIGVDVTVKRLMIYPVILDIHNEIVSTSNHIADVILSGDPGRIGYLVGEVATNAAIAYITQLALSAVLGKLGDVLEGAGKASKVDDLADGIKDWLGKDAKVITNQSGDKVFISQDGLRKVRFDINNPSPHNSPHAHFEQLKNGKWKPVNISNPQIYPIDVPHN